MSTPRSISPERKKLAEKFKRQTALAAQVRYGTMRKVDFSGWQDVGRFVKYAREHLAVAKTASQRLGYWKNLYELFTTGEIPHLLERDLPARQRRELVELRQEIQKLPPQERTSLSSQIQFQHRQTLDLLQKMAQEGILDPKSTPENDQGGGKLWAVAVNAQGKPKIQGGQLQLQPVPAPKPGRIFLEALNGAAKFRSDTGAPGKLGYFLGYAGRSAWNNLRQRPFLNSLTAKEKRSIEATNNMIKFLQQEWKPQTPNPMKKTPLNSEKRTSQTESRPHPIPEDSDEVTQVAAVRPQELSPSSSPQSGIVNHITINGEMSGDIGFQKNDLVPLSPHPESTAARAFPAPNRYPSHTHSPTKQKGRDRD